MRKFSEGLLNDNLILQTLNISSGQAILDAGCGSGYMSKKFANLVGELGRAYACDVDRGQIEILQKEFKDTNIEVFVGDITKKTDFDDSSLDLIYLSTVFHIFSKDQVESF
ncbi:MAG: class I SAM-dependent methyltransferase, partial [Gammaproteobacteria bacterium]